MIVTAFTHPFEVGFLSTGEVVKDFSADPYQGCLRSATDYMAFGALSTFPFLLQEVTRGCADNLTRPQQPNHIHLCKRSTLRLFISFGPLSSLHSSKKNYWPSASSIQHHRRPAVIPCLRSRLHMGFESVIRWRKYQASDQEKLKQHKETAS